jgi:hypothetical protein
VTNEQTRGAVARLGLSDRWSAYKNLMLRLFGGAVVGVFFYALFPHMPDFALTIILLVAVVVIWYDRDFPKRTKKSYATALFWLPLILSLFCAVIWKMTGEDVWARLGFACICVRAVYRVIDRAGALNGRLT